MSRSVAAARSARHNLSRAIAWSAALLTVVGGLAAPAVADDTPDYSPSCASIVVATRAELPASSYYNGGLPFLMDIGPDVSFTSADDVEVTATAGDKTRTFKLHYGHNDLRVHAGVSEWTEVTWDIPLVNGERCAGSSTAFTHVSADFPHLNIHTPSWGQVFDQGEKVMPEFDCNGNDYPVDWCTLNGIGIEGGGPVSQPNPEPEMDTETPGWHWAFGFAQDVRPNCPYSPPCGRDALTPVKYYVRAAPVPDPISYSVAFEQKQYPSGEWVHVGPERPVVAGNTVRAKVRLVNNRETTEEFSVSATADDAPVEGGSFAMSIGPKGTVERFVSIDTADLAWNRENNSPHLDPIDFRVDLTTSAHRTVRTFPFRVGPRPLILVHGWKSYAQSSWGKYQPILSAAHPLLKGYAVGDGQFPGTMNTNGGGEGDIDARTNTVAENAEQEALYIEGVRKATNAWHVDVLAHSMGGLISRYYLQELMPGDVEGRPVVNRLIQMGTPNRGSQLADMMMAFGARKTSSIPYYPASLQLTTRWVDGTFNAMVTDTRGVPVSNMVGTELPLLMMPLLPHLFGDGIVPAYSARWTLEDTEDSSFDFHTAMTESASDFRRYVLPRLVRPVADAHGRRAASAAELEPPSTLTQVSGVRSVHVDADGTAEVALPLEQSEVTGAMSADSGVSLEILDAEGNVLGRSQDPEGADSGEMAVVAKAHHVPAQAGTLRVTDISGHDHDVDVLTFVSGTDLDLRADVAPARGLAGVGVGIVSATLSTQGAPVTGASVTARVTDAPLLDEVTLLDDGRHHDGAAGDGTYAATVEGLPAGDHAAVVTATSSRGTRIQGAVVHVEESGEIAEPPAPAGLHLLSVATEGEGRGTVTATPDKDAYADGEQVTLTANPKAGSILVGWQVDGESRPADARLTLTMRSDRDVVAVFGPKPPNTAPGLALGPLSQGVTTTAGATWSGTVGIDDDAADSWTATVDYGGGAEPATIDGRTIRLAHRFDRAGRVTVAVVVRDGAGETGRATFVVDVRARVTTPVPPAKPDPATAVMSDFERVVRQQAVRARTAAPFRAKLRVAGQRARAHDRRAVLTALRAYDVRIRRSVHNRKLTPRQARALLQVSRRARVTLRG